MKSCIPTTTAPLRPLPAGPNFKNGHPVLVTEAGVCIGLLYQAPRHDAVSESMSRLQEWLLTLNRMGRGALTVRAMR